MTKEKKTHHLLVADDEQAMANVLKLKLEASGNKVTVAHDGQATLDLLDKDKFDLVLLDLMMPNTDGFAVLEAIKEKDIKVPVIVMSNLGQEEDIKRAKTLGAEDYLIKVDMSVSQIVQKVHDALNT